MNEIKKTRRKITIEEEVDRISELPVCLVDEIFSFLPLKNVVATSVLSKRWRYLWTHVTHLDLRCLVQPNLHYHKFFETVPKVLGGLTSQSIHTFVLQLMCLFRREDCCKEGLSCAESWIDQICSRNVRVVDIQFLSPKIRLPACLFASHSLVNLSLRVPILDFDLPEKIELPNLKYILLRTLYSGVEAHDVLMRTLSKSCPALESLELEISLERNISFDILGHNLKRLILEVHQGREHEGKFMINAPKLEYFEVTAGVSSVFDFAMIPTEKIELTNLKYIVLKTLRSGVESPHVLMRTLSKSCPALKSLELELTLKRNVSFDILGPNLKRLILKVYDNGQQHKAKFVINAPKLEFFEVTGGLSLLFDFAVTPNALHTAKISIYHRDLPTADDVRNMRNLFQGISNVKSLFLGLYSLSILSSISSANDDHLGLVTQLPLFRNLEIIHLDACLSSWKVSDWSGALPGCLLGKVKRVEVSNLRNAYCYENKIKLLEHLLENAPALEKFVAAKSDKRYYEDQLRKEDEYYKAYSKLLSRYSNRRVDVE